MARRLAIPIAAMVMLALMVRRNSVQQDSLHSRHSPPISPPGQRRAHNEAYRSAIFNS
jgi:hypothetical protein